MIRPNKEYKAFRGKVNAAGTYTTFSLSESVKNPQTNQWENAGWWSVVVAGSFPCEKDDQTRFTLTNITGMSQRQYNGKTYVSIFADAEVIYHGQRYVTGREAPAPVMGVQTSSGIAPNDEDYPF